MFIPILVAIVSAQVPSGPVRVHKPLVLVTSSKERKEVLSSLLEQKAKAEEFSSTGFHIAQLEGSGITYIDDDCVVSKLKTDFERLMYLIDQHPGTRVVQVDDLDSATRRAVGKLFVRSPLQGRMGATRTLVAQAAFAYRPFIEMTFTVDGKAIKVSFSDEPTYGKALCQDQLGPDQLREQEQKQSVKVELDRLEKSLESPATTFTFAGDGIGHAEQLAYLEQATQVMRKLAAKSSESRYALEQKALRKFVLSLGVKEWPLPPNTKFGTLPELFKEAVTLAAIGQAGPGANKAGVMAFLEKSSLTIDKSGYMIYTGYYDKASDTRQISGNSLASIRF